MGILINLLTIVIVLFSIFLILVILMQRGSAQGGLGAAMGGGMAESTFGADTTNVLTKLTRNVAIVFFVMVFGLYLAVLWMNQQEAEADQNALPQFDLEETATTGGEIPALMETLTEATGTAEQAAAELESTVEETANETSGSEESTPQQ